jgi:hypothetical protein
MNSNFTAVKVFCEDLSQGNNFDAGAIGTTDIADNAITSAKIATGAVTTGKIQTSVSLTTPILGVASATSIAVTDNVVYHITINATTGAYTLALTDDNRMVEMNNATGTTLTIPLNSSVAFPIGTMITILQTGVGQTTVAGAGGVTVNGTPGLKLRTQYSAATCIKRAINTWVLIGDLAA